MRTVHIMGVLNVTPDSFSDGGKWQEVDTALAHAEQMVQDGASIIDVGGESTRPGSARVSEEEEKARVLPVLRQLQQLDVTVSVDTIHANVAREALELGAQIINDVSGGLADTQMRSLVASSGCYYIAQHWKGDPETMNSRAVYDDVLSEVTAELELLRQQALDAGISAHKLVLDPGFGFGKMAVHDWTLITHLDKLVELKTPLIIGTSRKRFLGALADGLLTEKLHLDDNLPARDLLTAATSVIGALAGVWAVRVHDVAASAKAVQAAEVEIGRDPLKALDDWQEAQCKQG